MKKTKIIFLATKEIETFKESGVTQIVGIFSTRDKALKELKTHPYFNKAIRQNDTTWSYSFDSEMTTHYNIYEVEMDNPILKF